DARWPVQRLELEEGERLVIYTDGVTESESGGTRFGEERLRESLARQSSGAELLARLDRSLREFVSEPIQDDVAALTLGPDFSHAQARSSRVQTIEQIYDAFNRRAIGELRDLCLPEVELEVPTAEVAGNGGRYRGYEG